MKTKWPEVKLGELLAERKEIPSPNDLMLGKIKILEKISFDTGRIHLRTDGETRTGMILIRPGDLVVSGINAAKGAIAVYGAANSEPVAATIHYGSYVPNQERVMVEYLWWLLRSRLFKELLLEYVPGGIKTELKAKRFLPIPVALPSLAEQRRIVARIEEMAARIDEANTIYQQAAQEAEVLTSSLISARSYHRLAQEVSISELVGEGGLRNGKSVKSSAEQHEIRCLALSSMKNGRIDIHDSKPVPLSVSEARPFLVNRGDIFVMRGNGSKRLCGTAGLISNVEDLVIFPDLFIKVQIPRERIMPEFFVALWNSSSIRAVIEEKAKTTSGIWKINQGHILSTRIPVPTLPEQGKIIFELEFLQRQVDSVQSLHGEVSSELDAFLPSILDKAFKGKL